MSESIVLDPSAIAADRTELDITSWVAVDGVDWGDAAIEAYMAAGSGYAGSIPVDFRVPNRMVTIPLRLRTVGAVSFDTIRTQIQAKAALFQRERGWVGRTVNGTELFADVVNATLRLGGSWFQAYRDIDIDAVLTLECVPDFYGHSHHLGTFDEITLPVLDFTVDTINGNYPGRVQMFILNGDPTGSWHGLVWGTRSRYYDSDSTAALFYEAEDMTPLDAAATHTSVSGMSGSATMRHNSLPGGAWCPVLLTDLVSGTAALTHRGTYRVWARAYSATATPSLRLTWGIGDVAHPITNDAVQLHTAAVGNLVDLGVVRLDSGSIPSSEYVWKGVIQALATDNGDPVEIDYVVFQPLDESAGRCLAVQTPSTLGVYSTRFAGAGADLGTGAPGSLVWGSPGNIVAEDGASAAAPASTGSTHYLVSSGHGFALPSSATISGIQVDIKRQGNATVGPYVGTAKDSRVRLVKAGTVQSTDEADTVTPWPGTATWKTYGGPTDDWGGGWTYSDINNSGFGVALAITTVNTAPPAIVDAIRISVYYTTSGGFTTSDDAVVYAGQEAELRTDGMTRFDATGTVRGYVAQIIGDLPRIPPSGLEERTVEFMFLPSEGNFGTEPDDYISDIHVDVSYRPSYLITP